MKQLSTKKAHGRGDPRRIRRLQRFSANVLCELRNDGRLTSTGLLKLMYRWAKAHDSRSEWRKQ